MKCRKAQRLIFSYAELSSSQKKRLDEHVKSCRHCSHEFSLNQRSMSFVKEAVSFQESGDFWKDYRVNLERPIPSTSLLSRIWTKVEALTTIFGTPVLGPVPGYVFSFVLIALVTVSLYADFLSAKNNAQRFSNDLVPYGVELVSSADNGAETIYVFASR
jgi:hypothetical protein